MTYGARAFSIAGLGLWDELSVSLRKAADINSFKRQLKTHLFEKIYLKFVKIFHFLIICNWLFNVFIVKNFAIG